MSIGRINRNGVGMAENQNRARKRNQFPMWTVKPNFDGHQMLSMMNFWWRCGVKPKQQQKWLRDIREAFGNE